MERVLSNEMQGVEEEDTLRPSTLKEYIGQAQLKENLAVFIQAAKQRNEALDPNSLSWTAVPKRM